MTTGVSALEQLRRRQKLQHFQRIAAAFALDSDNLDRVLANEGFEGRYPVEPRAMWARGEITKREWIARLNVWAAEFVAANTEGDDDGAPDDQ